MLTGKKIAFIGGDERYIQTINHLAAKNADLFAVGFSEVSFDLINLHHCSMDEIPFDKIDGLVLPVSGMDETGHIQLDFPKDKTELTIEIVKKTDEHCIIYTGTANERLKTLAKESDRKIVILFERDDIAIANSIPTAEATLQIAMEETNRTIHGANILVMGFGRVGITMARLFQQVGANVTVAARKQADFARIHEMRMNALPIDEIHAAIDETDICINTVPDLVIGKKAIMRMKQDAIIIDVASKPGGTDFDAAKEQKIKTIHALGLPGKVAPITAGEIIGQTIATLAAENV